MMLSVFCIIGIMLITFFAASAIFIRFNCLIVTIEQSSMYPTLIPGDRILILRRWPTNWIRKGKIVLLKMEHLEPSLAGPNSSPSTLYIKRIVGIAGETLVTTQESEELISQNDSFPLSPEKRVWHIPASYLFVRGDNRAHSLDSHSWGPIPSKYVQGILLIRLRRTDSSSSTSLSFHSTSQHLMLGEDAPLFEASTLNGEIVNLQTYQRQSLLLIFFMPSRIVTPHFFQQHIQVPGIPEAGTLTLFISGATLQNTRLFLAKVHTDLPVLVAPLAANCMFQEYKVTSFPSYCCIDIFGKVIATGHIDTKESAKSSQNESLGGTETESGLEVSARERKYIV